jgi:hypothetical protein
MDDEDDVTPPQRQSLLSRMSVMFTGHVSPAVEGLSAGRRRSVLDMLGDAVGMRRGSRNSKGAAPRRSVLQQVGDFFGASSQGPSPLPEQGGPPQPQEQSMESPRPGVGKETSKKAAATAAAGARANKKDKKSKKVAAPAQSKQAQQEQERLDRIEKLKAARANAPKVGNHKTPKKFDPLPETAASLEERASMASNTQRRTPMRCRRVVSC